ncbi:hypothetical protein [Streptomyces silvisoli]|uniref:DUF2029 domain-containing protein n=1 Tax=Streptomyces silvisoli TaxID=3034235 RepID=A0ABT5ZPN0_9ACTN|nr:hypothetical protein [Streptomyces silvisoli]MDF3291606.1 hypothetical protein [Streptomyces silvisoli]
MSHPRVAVGLSAAGIGLLVLVGASAPNENTLKAPVSPFRLPAITGAVSAVMTCVAIVLSTAGLVGMLRAHDRGWSPSPRRLMCVGAGAALVVANLTPVGSSDMASYAAYGRIAALGGDPYVVSPAQLGDGYVGLVSTTWLHTPSVYGPVATWWQEAAAWIGGHRQWLTIWLLMLANAVVFIGSGYLLIRTAEDRVRAGLMWVANPVLIVVLAAGGHLDTIVAGVTVCAVAVARRAMRTGRASHDVCVGLLVGLACGIKISAALLGVGLIWPLLRTGAWIRAAWQVGAAAATLVLLYACYGLHALGPLTAASHLVSAPSLWQGFNHVGSMVVGRQASATATTVLWPMLMLVLAPALHRHIPPASAPVVAVPLALSLAWILAAPWSMPWYTGIAWALAAMAVQGPADWLLIAATSTLTLFHNSGGHGWTW